MSVTKTITPAIAPRPISPPGRNEPDYKQMFKCTFSAGIGDEVVIMPALWGAKFEAGIHFAVFTDEVDAELTVKSRFGSKTEKDGDGVDCIVKQNDGNGWYKDESIGDNGTTLDKTGLVEEFGGPNIGSGIGRVSDYLQLKIDVADKAVTNKSVWVFMTGAYGYRGM